MGDVCRYTHSCDSLVIFGAAVLFNLLLGNFVAKWYAVRCFECYGCHSSSTHADIAHFSTFGILPVIFLCNTFFCCSNTWSDPVDNRSIAVYTCKPFAETIGVGGCVSWISILILISNTVLFMLIALFKIKKQKLIEEGGVCENIFMRLDVKM